uniref:Carbonic anhydrase 4 n=1 Tax=Mus musculus TaxID=10090 RepID=D6RCZ3_MOUSE
MRFKPRILEAVAWGLRSGLEPVRRISSPPSTLSLLGQR